MDATVAEDKAFVALESAFVAELAAEEAAAFAEDKEEEISAFAALYPAAVELAVETAAVAFVSAEVAVV